jgi:presenilin-like A22 family membrane protease
MRNLKLNLFFKELLMFLLVQIFGLFAALELIKKGIVVYVPAATKYSSESSLILNFVFAFLIATVMLVILLRYFKRSAGLFKIIFAFSLFIGIDFIFQSLVSEPWALILALFFISLYFLFSKVWLHDLAIIIGIAGISIWLGFGFTSRAMIAILIIISIYDFIAVYKTKHMVSMFRNLSAEGVYFSTVIPEKMAQMKTNMADVRPEKGFMFLGTGDMAFPLMFAVSALPLGFKSSIGIIIGSAIGVAAVHLFFVSQKERKPMPALPPIAAGAIVGFLVSLVI